MTIPDPGSVQTTDGFRVELEYDGPYLIVDVEKNGRGATCQITRRADGEDGMTLLRMIERAKQRIEADLSRRDRRDA